MVRCRITSRYSHRVWSAVAGLSNLGCSGIVAYLWMLATKAPVDFEPACLAVGWRFCQCTVPGQLLYVRILIGQWRNKVKSSGRHFVVSLEAKAKRLHYLFTCNVALICSVFLQWKLSHNLWFYSHNTPHKSSMYITPQNPTQKAKTDRKDRSNYCHYTHSYLQIM